MYTLSQLRRRVNALRRKYARELAGAGSEGEPRVGRGGFETRLGERGRE